MKNNKIGLLLPGEGKPIRSKQQIVFSDMKKLIKRIHKELASHLYIYAAIVTVFLLVVLTSEFGGWTGLTAIGTLGVAFSVLYLEVLLPYIKRPRLTLTFNQEDKKCCREARIGKWQPKESRFETRGKERGGP